MAFLADRFGAPKVAAAVRGQLSHRRARTAIGPVGMPVLDRDSRLGVDDRIGVVTER